MSLDELGTLSTEGRKELALNLIKYWWMSRLAPLVEWLADRGDRAHDGVPVITRSITGSQRLRPTTRKVIMYDKARTTGVRGFAVACLPGMFTAAFLVAWINRGDRAGAIVFWLSCLPTAAVVALTLLMMVKRLREVREQIARSVVVQGSVTEAELFYRGDVNRPRTDLDLSVRYAYLDRWWEVAMTVRPAWAWIIGTTPELLVDTQNPGGFLILDFYV